MNGYRMTSLWEAPPSATYKNNVERDPPKQKTLREQLNLKKKKKKKPRRGKR